MMRRNVNLIQRAIAAVLSLRRVSLQKIFTEHTQREAPVTYVPAHPLSRAFWMQRLTPLTF